MIPGVYFNLPEEEYFNAGALGSTDLKVLSRSPADWWWGSRFNPKHEEADRSGMVLGKALHKLMLESREAFDEAFAIMPDYDATEGLLRTVDDLKQALTNEGVSFKSSANKQTLVDLCEAYEIGPIKDLMVKAFEVERGERTAISSEDADKAFLMADLAHGHHEIGPLLSGGRTEVSVFWELGGCLLRARFDLLLTDRVIDVKKIANWRGGDLTRSCLWQAADLGYDVQWALYMAAREELPKLVSEGQVFGGSDADNAWIQTVADTVIDYDEGGFVFLFYQEPDNKSGRAPIIQPIQPDFGSAEVFRAAGMKVKRGVLNYVSKVSEFGLENRWSDIRGIYRPTHYDWPMKTTEGVVG